MTILLGNANQHNRERPDSHDQPFLPLLITGIAGVAGYNAFQYFRDRYPGRVIGIRRPDNYPMSGDGVVDCDMTNRGSLERLFDHYRFAAVLNGEGSCKLKSCELDPEMAWRLNVVSPSTLLDVIAGRSVRLVHMSIDLVFSGTGQGNHLEHHPTDPVTVYGKTMAIAEQLILERRPESMIARISLPMGISFNGHAGAIDWIQSRFKKSRPATLYFDEIRTPTYTDCLNQLWEDILARRMSGIYHAGGPRHLSLYQIAQIVNRIGGYDPKHLLGCMRIEAGPMPPRAGNVTLDSRKLSDALGYDPFDPWPFDDRLVPTHRDWHWDRRDGEPGSQDLLERVLYRNPRRAS